MYYNFLSIFLKKDLRQLRFPEIALKYIPRALKNKSLFKLTFLSPTLSKNGVFYRAYIKGIG